MHYSELANTVSMKAIHNRVTSLLMLCALALFVKRSQRTGVFQALPLHHLVGRGTKELHVQNTQINLDITPNP